MNNYSDYLSRPVFISGYHKSGTTLLLSLLDGHPELVVFPEELHFFKNVLFAQDKAEAIRKDTGFKMFLPQWDHEILSPGAANFREGYPEFDCVQFDQLVENALRAHTSDKDLLLRLIDAFAKVDHIDPVDKLHWVSKTPRDEIFFPIMQKMFGREFKLIYIVRDPRDVYHSISKKKELEGRQTARSRSDLITFCIYWQTQLNRVISYQKKHQNVAIVRFEDVLTHTEDTLRRLCGFLQIEYSDELLQSTRHGKSWGGNSVFSGGFQGLSQEPIGRFRKFLDPERKAQLEQFLSKELLQLGYETPESLQTHATKNDQVPWLNYWIPYLRYQRWYFSTQYSAAFRYRFAQLFNTRPRTTLKESSEGEQFRASSN
jgi:sulfotransferase family protein